MTDTPAPPTLEEIEAELKSCHLDAYIDHGDCCVRIRDTALSVGPADPDPDEDGILGRIEPRYHLVGWLGNDAVTIGDRLMCAALLAIIESMIRFGVNIGGTIKHDHGDGIECAMCGSDGDTEEERRERYLADTKERIDELGRIVQGVFTDPPFAYTVGQTPKDLPELVITGLDPREAMGILNTVADYLEAHRDLAVEGTLPSDVFGNDYLVRLRAVATDARPFNFGTAYALYPDAPVRGLQVVFPDPEHRYPDDPGYEHPDIQVLLPAQQ